MLSHFVFSFLLQQLKLADVISKWQMELPLQKAPSLIFDHYNTTGHKICIENFGIVGREDQNLMRTIKEALYFRVNDPSLNRNIGKYHLLHIWDEVLFKISELKIIDQGNTICLLVLKSTSHHPAVAIPSATWK